MNDAGMGLNIGVMYIGSGKSVLNDDVRLAEARFDIALAPSDIDKIVGWFLERLRKALVVHHIGMNHPRARLHGLNRVKNRLGLFVLNFDEIDRFFGDQLIVRRDRRYFFANEPYLSIRKDRHVV